MGRPARCGHETALVRGAVKEQALKGSNRAKAAQLAAVVAKITLAHLRADDENFEAVLRLSGSQIALPMTFALATDPGVDVARVLVGEAAKQFEARGLRHLPAECWKSSDAALLEAVGSKLSERFRRSVK